MKAVKLGLLFISLLLIYSCKKNQVTSRIEVTTTLAKENPSDGSLRSFHWYIEIEDIDGIEQVTLRFSDHTTDLEFSNIFKKYWAFDAVKEFPQPSHLDSWTITAIVNDQDGNISEEAFTIDLQ
ncbi:MAG: hypothetical protein KTR30_35985 [Saprospiraceae bacterium]|nr:hypothetical protein [Saprospiraceae bacterium]